MKKTVSLRVIVILISLFMGLRIVSAQSIIERDNNTEQQFDVVDENATFPGGTLAALAFLHANVIYPKKAVKKKIEGRVIVSFVIEKDGSIKDVKIVKKVHPLLDAEVVRVVKSMPKWEPAKLDGKAVRSRFNLPVMFKLPNKDNPNIDPI